MRETLQFRNLALNSYISIFVITLVGSFAALYIVHIANDVPFSRFATPSAYAIDSSL
jgi:hypothetical protein